MSVAEVEMKLVQELNPVVALDRAHGDTELLQPLLPVPTMLRSQLIMAHKRQLLRYLLIHSLNILLVDNDLSVLSLLAD